jgi:hypothetical protein
MPYVLSNLYAFWLKQRVEMESTLIIIINILRPHFMKKELIYLD